MQTLLRSLYTPGVVPAPDAPLLPLPLAPVPLPGVPLLPGVAVPVVPLDPAPGVPGCVPGVVEPVPLTPLPDTPVAGGVVGAPGPVPGAHGTAVPLVPTGLGVLADGVPVLLDVLLVAEPAAVLGSLPARALV